MKHCHGQVCVLKCSQRPGDWDVRSITKNFKLCLDLVLKGKNCIYILLLGASRRFTHLNKNQDGCAKSL